MSISSPSLLRRTLSSLLILAVIAPLSVSAQVILMDFGGATSKSPEPTWNNIVENSLPSSPRVMTDSLTGLNSAISVALSGTWGTANSSGYATGNSDFIASATQDSLFINTGNTGIITFSGLNPLQTYTFTLFSSRTGTGERNVTFNVAGATPTNSVTVNSFNNTSSVAITAIAPAANGTFVLSVTNTNGDNFAYLNALKLEATPIPEPSTYAALLGVGALGLCLARRRR